MKYKTHNFVCNVVSFFYSIDVCVHNVYVYTYIFIYMLLHIYMVSFFYNIDCVCVCIESKENREGL